MKTVAKKIVSPDIAYPINKQNRLVHCKVKNVLKGPKCQCDLYIMKTAFQINRGKDNLFNKRCYIIEWHFLTNGTNISLLNKRSIGVAILKKQTKVKSLICNTFPWVKDLRVKNKTLKEDKWGRPF